MRNLHVSLFILCYLSCLQDSMQVLYFIYILSFSPLIKACFIWADQIMIGRWCVEAWPWSFSGVCNSGMKTFGFMFLCVQQTSQQWFEDSFFFHSSAYSVFSTDHLFAFVCVFVCNNLWPAVANTHTIQTKTHCICLSVIPCLMKKLVCNYDVLMWFKYYS
jgi:hypothetical protein